MTCVYIRRYIYSKRLKTKYKATKLAFDSMRYKNFITYNNAFYNSSKNKPLKYNVEQTVAELFP